MYRHSNLPLLTFLTASWPLAQLCRHIVASKDEVVRSQNHDTSRVFKLTELFRLPRNLYTYVLVKWSVDLASHLRTIFSVYYSGRKLRVTSEQTGLECEVPLYGGVCSNLAQFAVMYLWLMCVCL